MITSACEKHLGGCETKPGECETDPGGCETNNTGNALCKMSGAIRLMICTKIPAFPASVSGPDQYTFIPGLYEVLRNGNCKRAAR